MKYAYNIIPFELFCSHNQKELFSYDEEKSKNSNVKKPFFDPEVAQEAEEAFNSGDFEDFLRRQAEKDVTTDDVMKADFAITMTGQIVVTAGTVARVVAEWTGLPLTNFSQDDKDRFRGLGPVLTNSIIGQPRAIKVISK